jgi:hypothetical protein
MTVVRAQDGTTARAYSANDRFELRPTAALFNEKVNKDGDTMTGALTVKRIELDSDASGTGIFTLKAPNSNTNRELTLPDEAGTLDTIQRAGNVLQVVSATTTTPVTVVTASYTDTGLTASITPISASSKILVIVAQSTRAYRGAVVSGRNAVRLRLLRDATAIYTNELSLGFLEQSTELGVTASLSVVYLDSPATTSAITYKIQGRIVNSGYTWAVNRRASNANNSGTSTITLMEIAG